MSHELCVMSHGKQKERFGHAWDACLFSAFS